MAERAGAGVRQHGVHVCLVAIAALAGCGLPVTGRGVARVETPRQSVLSATPIVTVSALPSGRALTLRMGQRESLPSALARAGLDAKEAAEVAASLADEFDTANPHPGLPLYLQLASPDAPARLLSLSLQARDAVSLLLTRKADGALSLRRTETPVFETPHLVAGKVDGSLFLSVVAAGVSPDTAAKVASLFGRRLDLSRDVESGDRFRLVFEQRRAGDGRPIGADDLIYAEIAAHGGRSSLYRYAPGAVTAPDYVDGEAGPAPVILLRTPVDGARVTSGFGPRLHPILGFTRMHQGVDFGAASGSPVLAAGDGVVEEARWAGEYGRWLKIRHASGLETGYAHLSAWATNIGPGVSVRQGQVVGYVGATGLATGPHLHYEVFEAGRRVDPRAAGAVQVARRDPAADQAFRAAKARIDATVATITSG